VQVVGHYDIAHNKVALAFDVVKLFIYYVITIGALKQGQPVQAGERDKVNTVALPNERFYSHAVR
jgi:hypothetical protein